MTASEVVERFERALEGARTVDGDPALLPSRWARAVARSLPVDAAALSLHSPEGLRTPLGSSDADAALAERLQFALGIGPCLHVHDTGSAIVFDEDDLGRNWPQLHRSLVGRTPFRAVLSTPLLPPVGPTLVLDLYAREMATMARLDRDEVETIAVLLTRHALLGLAEAGEDEEVAWWRAPEAQRRRRVWQAMALVAAALDLAPDDALAVLSAHAVATDRVAEDVAEEVLAGRLLPADLPAAPHGG
jgi:hypothetical protein